MVCIMLQCKVCGICYVWASTAWILSNNNPCCTTMASCLQFWVKVPSGWSSSGIGRHCWQLAGPVALFSCRGATSAPPPTLESSRSSWWRRASAEPDHTVSSFYSDSRVRLYLQNRIHFTTITDSEMIYFLCAALSLLSLLSSSFLLWIRFFFSCQKSQPFMWGWDHVKV